MTIVRPLIAQAYNQSFIYDTDNIFRLKSIATINLRDFYIFIFYAHTY